MHKIVKYTLVVLFANCTVRPIGKRQLLKQCHNWLHCIGPNQACVGISRDEVRLRRFSVHLPGSRQTRTTCRGLLLSAQFRASMQQIGCVPISPFPVDFETKL